MQKKYIIIGIFVMAIILIASIYLYNQNSSQQPQGETLYGYKVGNSQVISSTSFSSLDEASAKTTAEEAIKIFEEADYKFECLIFDSAEKRTDSRNGEEFWSVGFTCNEECSKTYINCGAAVMIKSDYEIIIGFPNSISIDTSTPESTIVSLIAKYSYVKNPLEVTYLGKPYYDEEVDVVILEDNIKGPFPSFKISGNKIVPVEYPGSYNEMAPEEFVDYVVNVIHISKEEECIASGGNVVDMPCYCWAEGIEDFPDFDFCTETGLCACDPEGTDYVPYSKSIKICECPEGKCFNGSVCVDS